MGGLNESNEASPLAFALEDPSAPGSFLIPRAPLQGVLSAVLLAGQVVRVACVPQ